MDKAPDAFRTISEVAEDLDLPQHVLRFWETRFSHIKPLKRGGGRRYYRPDDVELLRGIRYLLYSEGYTIKGVQRILKENGVRAVQTIWQVPEAAEDDGADYPARPALTPHASDYQDPDYQDPDYLDDEEADELAAAGPSGFEEAAAAPPVLSLAAAVAPAPLRPPVDGPPAAEAAASAGAVSIVRGGLNRTKTTTSPAPAAARKPEAAGVSAEDAQTLKAVLFELTETRRLLDAALSAKR